MIQTLLLCFIHGFKGDEETFFQFPEDLRKHVQETCPKINVHTAIYPKYETRGDLAACVETFREWLQDQVTDLETNAATPSAILDPSVSVILCAHSMGGFVAADTLFSVLSNRPVSPDPNTQLMFPLVQGLISFDTPYNGLARSMFAYGAFSQYQNISGIWNIASTLSGGISMSAAKSTATATSSQIVASQASSWKRWQALAARSGTYGAIIAGGVAAYMHREQIQRGWNNLNRENISKSLTKENLSQGLSYVSRDSIGEGFTWMASHLKFVGALMKQEQMTTRIERLAQLKGVGVSNLYTSLGENGYWTGGYFVPKRTFCAIPTDEKKKLFVEMPNTKSDNEIVAHCSMFQPERNSSYDDMLARAGTLVRKWVENDPRQMVDDYKPDERQRAMSISESEVLDDDGKMKKEVKETESTPAASQDEDEQQLKAILACQDLPQPEDGGVDEEALKQALEIPLPADDSVDTGTAPPSNSNEPGPKSSWMPKMSVPAMPAMPSMPAVSMPSMPSMPAMPSFRSKK